MKLLLKNTGNYAIFDRLDYPVISKFHWYETNHRVHYIYKTTNGKSLSMHRLLLGIPNKGFEIDHINGNGDFFG